MLKLVLVLAVVLGCVLGSPTSRPWTAKTSRHMPHNEFPTLSELGLDSRRSTTGPTISAEYKAKGTSESKFTNIPLHSTPYPASFYSSAKLSSEKNHLRYYIPYYPENGDEVEKIDFDTPIPPAFENASWSPITDTFIVNSEKEYVLINGVCRPLPFTYYDVLSISPYTTFTSTSSVRGIDADVYTFNSSHYNVTLYVEKANNSIPLQYVGQTRSVILTYDYHVFIGGVDFSPSVFEVPSVCEAPGVVCNPSPQGNEDLLVYRYHAPDDFNLANQNGASDIGVVSFVCEAVYTNQTPGLSWISKFNVEVDTAWGNYGLCNVHNCWTLNKNAVGREYSYGVTDGGGQCEPDSPLFGEWYSFTGESQCPPGEPVSPQNHCSWSPKETIATIDVDCLLSMGFLQNCKQDRGFPFPTASATLASAFESCPDPSQN